jgi:hypothetical protein
MEEITMATRFLGTESKLQTETAAAMSAKLAADAKGKGANGMKRGDSKFSAIQNEGAKVKRDVLSPWETYVHALLFSNEAAYVN